MSYAIELNKRQSNRIIEQALRRQAEIMLETRTAAEDEPLVGEIEQDQACTLALSLQRDPGVLLDNLIGVYTDGHLSMGESRYLFSTHIIDVTPNGRFGRLIVARPETVLVVQRRRFWRAQLAESSQVRVSYDTPDGPEAVLGSLCNISPGGLAMKLDQHQAEGLLIGETVQAHFVLPELDRTFNFEAIVCSKTPAGSPEAIILGVQFTNVEPTDQRVVALRNHLRGGQHTVAQEESQE